MSGKRPNKPIRWIEPMDHTQPKTTTIASNQPSPFSVWRLFVCSKKNSGTLVFSSFSDPYENQCFLNDEKSRKTTTTKGDLKLCLEENRK